MTYSQIIAMVAVLAAGMNTLAEPPASSKPVTPASQPKPAEHKPKPDGFRDTFTINKADLASTGSGKYFILQPGRKMTYSHGDEQLVVSVLDETKVVDGVTTRVIEERETKGGALKEVSRNYYAIDPKTGDVYYFGEDVDIYENGKVAKHEGEWLSGKDGARFGLFIPGEAKVGDKFYQEIAPKKAMDRFEVISIAEKVETPAGKYENVVKTEETTPLEPDKSHKWFAPGVGMIRDGELVLTKVEPEPAPEKKEPVKK